MGMLMRTAVFTSLLLFCNALLDLSGPSEIEGVWKATTTLPCSYVPMKDFLQQTLTWAVEHDQSSRTIFRRDNSGDHVLLSEYRDRVEVPKNSPGNVSLHIGKLEISDKGTYTCRVTWRASNNSLVTREISTRVQVLKVAVTKPVIRAGEPGLVLPAGASTSLTCVASGSPPISYRWFRGEPGGAAQRLGSRAELPFDRLQPSHAGKYYCEAENRIGALLTQQSDAVELVVTDPPAAPTQDTSSAGSPVATGLQRQRLPLYVVFLLAGLCGAALISITVAIACRGKSGARDRDEPLYEVAFRSTVDVTRTETAKDQEEVNSRNEASYETITTKGNDYSNICTGENTECETLVKSMETEYE